MQNIAVVILNWNGLNLLKSHLPNVIKNSGNARIIVADNASTDDSVDFIKNNFPTVEIISNLKNEGFAKGYNEALKRIESEFYVLLNNDVEVSENWLNPLINVFSDSKVVGCQPKIISFNDRSSFEHAGASGGYIDRNYFPFCRGRIFDAIEKDNNQYDSKEEVFWSTGAALMIRAKEFHSVNGFDEDFFAHMEEIDLCWRLKKKGFKFMVEPSSKVYHIGGGTLPYQSPKKVYLNFRNSLMMLIKNHEGMLFPKLFNRLCLDGIAAIRFIFKGEFKQFAAVFNAHLYQYARLGSLLKKRKAIKKASTVFNASGIYKGSIVWKYYVKGVRQFSQLNKTLFR
jgi:GT2 family glycosyltransferase